MYTCNWAPQCLEAAQIVRTDLRAIGITTDIRAFPTPLLYRRLARRAEPWDIAFMEWGADFADPSNFINSLFDPASQFNYGRFDDPSLTERMRHAATLGGDHRLRAYARLDEELARRDAPVAAWATDANREFFSARVGCQIYQPIYGTDLGSLCLRP